MNTTFDSVSPRIERLIRVLDAKYNEIITFIQTNYKMRNREEVMLALSKLANSGIDHAKDLQYLKDIQEKIGLVISSGMPTESVFGEQTPHLHVPKQVVDEVSVLEKKYVEIIPNLREVVLGGKRRKASNRKLSKRKSTKRK